MQKLLIVLAAVGGIGSMVPIAATKPGGEGIATLAHSLVAGVILGSDVWPYSRSPLPPELQAKLLLDAPGCGWPGQCDPYGLASTAFIDRQNDTGGDE
jgi:hypothetical protein